MYYLVINGNREADIICQTEEEILSSVRNFLGNRELGLEIGPVEEKTKWCDSHYVLRRVYTLYGNKQVQVAHVKLPDDSLKTIPLKRGQVVVSHIGDGEYNFNVFGGVHTSYEHWLDALVKTSGRTKEEFFLFEIVSASYSRSERRYDVYQYIQGKSRWWPGEEVGYLTVETLNPAKVDAGYVMRYK